MRLWEVQSASTTTAKLKMLGQRGKSVEEAVKGSWVAVRGSGGLWDAKVVE